jgi:spermidine synthase
VPRSYAVLLVASGASALVFETLWVKQLGRVVGVEVHAVSVALSAFFAGLALGGWLLGRRADRSRRPLRLYALLEGGAALLGGLATLALARAAAPFVALLESVGPLAWALPFALVGAPAVLMGGTLPALLRAARPAGNSVGRASGALYAANTAGAVAGTLAAAFVLVPRLGITGSAFTAGGLGLAAAIAALVLDRRREPLTPVESRPSATFRYAPGARFGLALYAVAGAIALGYEVVWSELLVQFLSTRAFAFAVMLATYLTGLALGAALYARFARPRHDPWLVFGLLLASAAGCAIGAVSLIDSWLPDAQVWAGKWALRLTGSVTFEMLSRFLVASSALLLLPTTLLGAAFPAAARLCARAEHVGGEVGAVTALNTIGGVAGTLMTGFVLVPRLGLVRSLGLLALAGATLGAAAVLRTGWPRARVLSAAMVVGTALLAFATPRDRLAHLLAMERGGALLFYREDVGGTVAVIEQSVPSGETKSFRRLYIQGVSNSGDAPSSMRYMRLQALLPLLVHPREPRSALVVGFGTGITAGALLAWPDLETRVVAELLPAVVSAGERFRGNLGAATDSRLDIRIVDGRQELMRSAARYDLVTLEPPPPSAAGVANLYSREFYVLCRQRLASGGLMAQWWPLPTQNDEDSRSLVRTFLDAFPHVAAWTTELHEVLLVGSTDPMSIDGARVAARFGVPAIAQALAEVGVESPAALLATYLTDRQGLERYAGEALPVTDDRPRIEHAAWVRRGELRRVLPRLLELATPPPLAAGDPLAGAVSEQRDELLLFYRGSLDLLAGDRQAAGVALREVFDRDPENPYYGWVIGRSR